MSGRVIKPGGSEPKINERLPFWQMQRPKIRHSTPAFQANPTPLRAAGLSNPAVPNRKSMNGFLFGKCNAPKSAIQPQHFKQTRRPPSGRVIKPGGSEPKINERLPFWQMQRPKIRHSTPAFQANPTPLRAAGLSNPAVPNRKSMNGFLFGKCNAPKSAIQPQHFKQTRRPSERPGYQTRRFRTENQ
ncbi:MAG: hypothetical protein H6577_13375 [Lewinellaceae bacterium]|nr:hypothetical protein [Lewinellaceae bacterium]